MPIGIPVFMQASYTMVQTGNQDPGDVPDPANQIQSGYYDNGTGGTINGIDTRESTFENWNGSRRIIGQKVY
jgi:hypothetical protein